MNLLPLHYEQLCTVVAPVQPTLGRWTSYSSGFYLGVPIENSKNYRFILITSQKAVMTTNGQLHPTVYVSQAIPRHGRREQTKIDLTEEVVRLAFNVAAIKLHLGNAKTRFRYIDLSKGVCLETNSNKVWEGVEILTPGFPEQSALINLSHPFVRGGTIARNQGNWFFIDSNVFPRHEGAPVFLRPTRFMAEGDLITSPYFIGVVAQAICSPRDDSPLVDEAVSLAGVGALKFIADLVKDFQDQEEPGSQYVF